ncbi:hypothetical protein [Luteimonas galliterrae]|nr:hypothetical protein [Luteimonas galliterrae]
MLEAGIDMQLSPLATLGVSYSGQLADDAQEHSAQAQLQVKF